MSDISNSTNKPLLTKQQQRAVSGSPLRMYKELVVGEQSWLSVLRFELVTGLGDFLPGLMGMAFRTVSYPILFQRCGKRPYFGKGVTLRNPGSVGCGTKVLIDESVTIDCRSGSQIQIGDHCAIGKSSILAAKGGDITLESGVNVGTFSRIATQTEVFIGAGTLVAAYVYIGPGNHQWDSENKSFISGEMELKGGVHIGKNVWIGTRATILEGVTIGDGALVGAHSLVKSDVPAGAIVAGTPAKVVGQVQAT